MKFGGSHNSPGTQRWSDLLVCEHLARQVLPTHLGLRAVTSLIHRHDGRTFLEAERFDRHGLHGRSGVASWASVNGDLVGLEGAPWTEAWFRPRPPLPAEREHWEAAARAATVFWHTAAVDARISSAFRATCATNAETLARML